MDYSLFQGMPVFDSHLHLQLCNNLDLSRLSLYSVNSRFICNATGADDFQKVLDICSESSLLIPAIGIHPWNAGTELEDRELLVQLVKENNCRVLGECGLDKIKNRENYKKQIELLKFQLDLAGRFDLAVSLHCVRAWGDLLDIIKKHRKSLPSVMIHAYSGSVEMKKELEKLEVHISFSLFTLKRKNSKISDCLKAASDRSLLLDTDFPYDEMQDLTDYNSMMQELYETAAETRDTDPVKLSELIYRNGKVYSSAAAAWQG